MTLAEVSGFIVAAFSAFVRALTSVQIAGLSLSLWFIFYILLATIISMLFDTRVPGSVVSGSRFGKRKGNRNDL